MMINEEIHWFTEMEYINGKFGYNMTVSHGKKYSKEFTKWLNIKFISIIILYILLVFLVNLD